VTILEESAQGRTLGARLLLRQKDFAHTDATQSPWPLRYSDLDAVGHMNNAAY
jgi:acyl-ACP thioesterase